MIRSDLAHDHAVTTGFGCWGGGRHGAMLISKLAGMQTLRNLGIGGVEPLETRDGFSQRFAFAVRRGDTDLLSRVNEGLALAKADGVQDRLCEHVFGVYDSRSLGWRELWPPLLGAALVAAVVWLIALRRRLRRDRRNAAILRDSEARWKEIPGYGDDETGTSAEEWSSRIHPDDVRHVMRENPACIDGSSDQFVAEFRMRAKDGRWVWVLDRGKVVDRSPDDMTLRMIDTHTDSGARKAAEARDAGRAQLMT